MLLACGCQSSAREPTTAASAAPSANAAAPAMAPPLDRNLARPDVIATSAPLAGFMRGLNLGNGLDAPKEGEWGVQLGEQHFAMAAAAGFDHVRLPARFSTPERTQVTSPFKVEEQFFQRVDWAIERALAHRLSIIVDLHHYEEIHKDPEGHRQRFYAIWQQIAERYADRPAQVAFELLNEPNGALEPKLLNELTAEALRIVRKTNPTRIVFANCYAWANAERLAELQLPADDPNVVAQFHMYQPILFTHQGASWMSPAYHTRGVVFPGPPATPLTPVAASESETWIRDWFSGYNQLPAERNPNGPRAVFEHFDHAARYVQATSKRVYLGEFGAIDAADEQSRENWTWLVRSEAERRGIGWAYWDDGSQFKVMDPKTGQWNERLRRALLER
jgi:endoglucanase